MLVFNKHSWHYKLIAYTFTEKFFLDTEIDWKATEDQTIGEHSRDGFTPPKDFQIIYKTKPKTVNLCPYLRALVGAVITFPFVVIYKQLPKKERKPLTHAEIMKNMRRRTMWIRILAASANIGFGIRNLTLDEPVGAIIQFAVAAFVLTGHMWFKPVGMAVMKFLLFVKLIKKDKPKKPKQASKPKEPSLLLAKLNAEHDKICPPIFFIDKSNEVNLK